MTWIRKIFQKREVTAFIFLIVIFLIVGLRNSDFISSASIETIMKGSVIYILLALGMTFVLLTGGIDVSVGAVLGISAAVSATMIRDGQSVWLAVLVAMALGLFIGLINGFGVAVMRIPSIIMTLGVLGITRGFMIVYTDGKWVENLPDSFKQLAQGQLGGINLYFLMVILLVAVVQFFLSQHRKGKYFAAVGDNADGAVLVGINVKRVTLLAYVISSLCAAMAGILFTSQVGFVTSNTGLDIEMMTIAACVLGGVSLSGGTGSVVGASVGALIMTTINSALVFLKVPSFWNKTIQGSLLIAIVIADVLIQKHFQEKARRERLSARAQVMPKSETKEALKGQMNVLGGHQE